MIWLVDISRLVETAHLATPTGIDRVEMAYAKHFLTREGDVRFVITWPHFTGLLSREQARDVIEAIEKRWSQPQAACPYADVQSALRAPIAREGREGVASFGAADDAHNPRSWSNLARLWLASLASRLTDGHIEEFRDKGATYVHVSQFRLNRPQRFEWLVRARAKAMFMLHDLIPVFYPEYCRPGEAARHAARVDTMVRHASLVIANSQFTRGMLGVHFEAMQRPMPRCEVVPLGIAPVLAQATVPQVEAGVPYFVAVGTIEPRKNILFLLSVWHRWTQGGQNPRARLVIVGRRGWENENIIGLLERSAGLAPSVIEVSSLSDAGMAALLKGAAALVAPSFVEGFGLPVAEALALGVPVLASDIPAHREVGGDFAEYIDPLDGPGWMQAFDDYCAPQSARRQAALSKLQVHEPMTWPRHIARVEELLAG